MNRALLQSFFLAVTVASSSALGACAGDTDTTSNPAPSSTASSSSGGASGGGPAPGDTTGAPATASGTTSSGSTTTAPPSDGACALDNVAPDAKARSVAEAPPAMTGGTIADGLYALTEEVVYTGPSGNAFDLGTVKDTLQVSDMGTHFALASTATYPAGATICGTMTASGSEMSVNYMPGSVGHPWEAFTATATTLQLETTSNGTTTIATYTLLPAK